MDHGGVPAAALPIPDDAVLWRRIHPDHVVDDDNLGRKRPTTAAFRDDELSVVVAKADRDPQSVLIGLEKFSLVSIIAGTARALGLEVSPDPTGDEPAHALILGRKTRSIQNALAKAAVWVVGPLG